MTRKLIIVAIVAMLAMGTSAALALGASPQATTDATMAQETTTAVGQTTTVAETANVTFQNQSSNGSAVVVERVVVPEGGFIAIHEAESAAQMTETEMATETAMETPTAAAGEAAQRYTAGAVIGNSTYLEPGVHENVTVQLDQPLEESQVLIAMPHLDTNDNQQYEFPEADEPYTQAGQAVTDWANVTVEAGAAVTTTAAGAQTTTEEM
ncbi:DUF7282 domain-containing protein [Halorussus aquaticus]|uniref:DUF7282 domain-containing protein n=1 Tax=Halorussus aquaticus TaxID=2953748 RepID=A0ABD5PYB0_9EURY|nr:hypothetical protein [Halorussus aquaticus]